MLKIYNSLTQKKEVFTPVVPGKVSMYVCGVTVYDYCHLGHARTYTAFDVIIRFLRSLGFDVTYVRNITDIDDKIIKRAEESKTDFSDIVSTFTRAMHEDFQAIGLLAPNVEPKATEYIPQIIALIETLIAKEYAYVASNGDVYYEVRRFKHYGCLAHRDLDKLESGARVEVNDVKRDPLDFVLWKLAKPNEPKWPSPWGDGRPGWHSECSAMSMGIFGETFDIHGGGKDLIFPHHENELAQAEAASDKPFVKNWMHAGFLQIDKEKMSKSLGNFFTIRDALGLHAPEVLRCFLISSQYRSPLQFSESALQQARQALERLYTALRDLPAADSLADTTFEKAFHAAMCDDFNTPVAMSVLFDLAHEIQRLREKDLNQAASLGALLKKCAGILGILQDDPWQFLQSGLKDNTIAAVEIEAKIQQRLQAKANKDWAEADRIRKELAALSIILEDNAEGTTWKVST